MRLIFLMFFFQCCAALSNVTLIDAFAKTFKVKDSITDPSTPVMSRIFHELDKLGIDSSMESLCTLSEEQVALILMKAVLAEYELGLQEDNDWNVVADLETGQLTRTKIYSLTCFAIIESLLVASIATIVYVLWKNKTN